MARTRNYVCYDQIMTNIVEDTNKLNLNVLIVEIIS